MPVTLHHGTCFVLCGERGDLDPEGTDGLYFEDVRCLSTFRVVLDGEPLLPLGTDRDGGEACTFFCTNARGSTLKEDEVVVRRARRLGASLHEELVIESYADEPKTVGLCVEFDADFADIYAVKTRALAGRDDPNRLPSADVDAEETRATLARTIGATTCRTELAFSRPPRFEKRTARFDVELARGRPWRLTVDVVAHIDHPDASRSTRALGKSSHEARRGRMESRAPTLESDHPFLADAYARAAEDFVELRLNAEENIEGEYAVAAGIPWYMALFGRDSLIASYQSLLHDPELARGTLTALAHLQGRHDDPSSEEQPGRILHEYRKYLRASVRRNIPKFPYYGTIDATPLWLVTLSEYVRCTGDVALARTLWPNVERALAWIERDGDFDGDGLVEYRTKKGGFLVNEGWKDSSDSVRFHDGALAKQPIALVEVQGYVADAWARVAELADDLGDKGASASLREKSKAMRARIAERYWLDERRFFAEALDGDKRRVDALTSNPGHLLWSRAVDEGSARAVADVLLGEEMFTAWGVRTMGAREGGYDPVSYHDGSIWPHDNSLLLQGLVRYGLHDEARRLADALLDALGEHPHHRYPELWSGFDRDDASHPIAYPNANEPQAWASGAVLLLVRALVGLEIDAVHRRVRMRPTPLSNATYLRLRDVPIAGARATIDVRFDGPTPRARVDGLPSGFRVEG